MFLLFAFSATFIAFDVHGTSLCEETASMHAEHTKTANSRLVENHVSNESGPKKDSEQSCHRTHCNNSSLLVPTVQKPLVFTTASTSRLISHFTAFARPVEGQMRPPRA